MLAPQRDLQPFGQAAGTDRDMHGMVPSDRPAE
jgi:hypothetical protein